MKNWDFGRPYKVDGHLRPLRAAGKRSLFFLRRHQWFLLNGLACFTVQNKTAGLLILLCRKYPEDISTEIHTLVIDVSIEFLVREGRKQALSLHQGAGSSTSANVC